MFTYLKLHKSRESLCELQHCEAKGPPIAQKTSESGTEFLPYFNFELRQTANYPSSAIIKAPISTK